MHTIDPSLLSSWPLVVLLVVFRTYSALPSPFEEEGHVHCRTNYLNVNYACDPDAVLSRSELERFDHEVRDAFCYCGQQFDPDHSCPQKYTIAMVAAQAITVNRNEARDAMQVLSQWNQGSKCRTDILLYIFSRAGARSTGDFYVTAAYSPFFLRNGPIPSVLQEAERNSLDTDQLRSSLFARMSRFLLSLPPRPLTATDSINVPVFDYNFEAATANSAASTQPSTDVVETRMQVTQWPTWAIIVFVGCILFSGVLWALGTILNKGHRSKYFGHASHVSIRMANQRWRAGFVGGLMSRDTQATKPATGPPAGPPKTAMNTMMFRQFSRASRYNQPPQTTAPSYV